MARAPGASKVDQETGTARSVAVAVSTAIGVEIVLHKTSPYFVINC